MNPYQANAEVHSGRWVDYDPKKFTVQDPLGIDAVDYVEIYCGNARQAAYFYAQAFGFNPVAYRGPETGYRDSVSYVLQQNKATLLLTGPLHQQSPIAAEVLIHGDTVHSIAFRVEDCAAFYHTTLTRGAQSAEVPTEWKDENGSIRRAAIKQAGNVVHEIVERSGYKGLFWPGFVPIRKIFPDFPQTEPLGLIQIDHCVTNVELGRMNYWVEFYENVLGFKQITHFTDDDISTEYSALMSKVMRNGSGKIKMPINEPAQGRRKSQIEEYLEFHNGPGIQHVAMLTGDIIKTVSEMRKRGVGFLHVPKTYYPEAKKRVGTIKQDFEKIAELGILVDRDDDGYLLQLFTKTAHDRPTLFYEVIQREGSQGFGVGNFKALFESIERDQAERGNL